MKLYSVEVIEAILESIDEGVHIVDHHGISIFYNRVAAAYDGVQAHEVIGKHILHTFPSLTPHTSTLLNAIRTGASIFHQPQAYKNQKGEVIETINTTIPIITNGEIVGAVEVARDYSKIKHLTEHLFSFSQDQPVKSPKIKSRNHEIHVANHSFNDFHTQNQQVLELLEVAMKAADIHIPILVFGETGTGKELLVQAIHNHSNRKKQPFIAQNCAALPKTLLESLLFGTKKGSFTGATDRAGLFEIAHGGTLFLDEINSMPVDTQAALLRVLEDGVVRRVGAVDGVKTDVRVIAAMNEDPQKCMEKNTLRRDLYYRLSGISLEIPPLRERPDDIEWLTIHFLHKFNQQQQKNVTHIQKEVKRVFQEHSWPGNIRELANAIKFAINMCEANELTVSNLPIYLRKQDPVDTYENKLTLPTILKKVEAQYIQDALQATNGNVRQAAKRLGIPRQTLQYKMQKQSAE